MATAAEVKTPHHRFLDYLMLERTEQTLRAFVMAERGKRRVWRLIAADVCRITGEDVSQPTLIAWFAADPEIIAVYESAMISAKE